MTRRALALLLLAVLPAAPGESETGTPGAPWRQVRTEHFELLSNGPPDFARGLAESLEQLRQVLAQLAPNAVAKARHEPRIFLFQDRGTYHRYSPRGSVEGLGYLFPHPDRYYAAVLGHPNANPQALLYKQYIHQLLVDNLPALPEWFRHGLAEYYSTFGLEGEEASIGRPVRGHVLNLRGSPTLSLAQLRAGREGADLDARDLRLFVSRSWGLVHFLLSTSDQRHRQTLHFLRQIAAGHEAEAAFRQAFGEADEELEGEVMEYLHQDRFQHLIVQLPPLETAQVRTRTLSEAEAKSFLGDLLAHLGTARRDEAESLLREAVALEPEHGPAWYGLGFLAREGGEAAKAAEHFERAARWGPESFLAHFAYGDALLQLLGSRRPETDEDLQRLELAKAALRRATRLDEGSADAWNRLGFALALDPEASQEGADALQTALKLAPGRTDVVLNLLLVHARLGDDLRVDDMWQALQALKADPPTLTKAREVRLQLRFNRANQLIRDSRFADAAGVFAQVRSETGDPTLAQLAGDRFEQVSAIAKFNRFAELYQQAKDALAAGRQEEAAPLLRELLEVAEPGLQQEVAEELATRGID